MLLKGLRRRGFSDSTEARLCRLVAAAKEKVEEGAEAEALGASEEEGDTPAVGWRGSPSSLSDVAASEEAYRRGRHSVTGSRGAKASVAGDEASPGTGKIQSVRTEADNWRRASRTAVELGLGLPAVIGEAAMSGRTRGLEGL